MFVWGEFGGCFGLKNVEAQSSGSGMSASKVYDAFGAELASTGSWKGTFGYAGGFGYQADSSGLKLLGHRYYDPSVGRFLTRDPIKDGRNWYVYCGNNPLTKHDWNGLEDIILPKNPAELAKYGWTLDTSHQHKGGQRWIHPNGQYALEFYYG